MPKKSILMTLCALSAVTAMTIATATLADSNMIPIDKGAYVGANVGYGGVGNNPFTNSNQTLGLVYGVNGGYQFNKYFALEGGYIALPNVTLGDSKLTKNNSMLDIAAKGIIPLDGRFNVYGKFGVARVSTEYTAINAVDTNGTNGFQHRTTPYYGLGVGIAISHHTQLTVEYDATPKSTPVPSTHALLTGLQLKF